MHSAILLGLLCSSSINNGNSDQDLKKNGLQCSSTDALRVQTMMYEPAYNVKDNLCVGYVSIGTDYFKCNATAPNGTRRLCNCVTQGTSIKLLL